MTNRAAVAAATTSLTLPYLRDLPEKFMWNVQEKEMLPEMHFVCG